MAPAFGPDVPVLAPGRVVSAGGRASWLLWPALQYRVVTPEVHEPMVNVFQRALLGLARAGLRDLADIATLLGLEIEFAELVRDDLRTLRYLDQFGAITQAGSAALADGFLDPHRVVVTHVYQDLFTGALWPAAVQSPMLTGARWLTPHRAELDLGTAGNSVPIRPLAVPADGPPPETPAADEIVEAVSRGAWAPQRADGGAGWQRRAPARVAGRVSLITAGQPVYLPVAVVIRKGSHGDAESSATWIAISPFTGRESHLLRRLIAIRCGRYPALLRAIENLLGRPAEALLAEFDRISADVQAEYRERLERRFGPGLRDHRELVELLTLLELNAALASRPGERAAELNAAANAGWRIQELVLRRVIRDHPPRPGGLADERRMPAWQQLMAAGERIGLRSTEYLATTEIKRPEALARALRAPRPTTPELLAALVLSGDQGPADHPARRLAGRRPTLLTDLKRASQIRNEGSHEALEAIDLEFVRLSRRLAYETAAAFLGVPVPDDE